MKASNCKVARSLLALATAISLFSSSPKVILAGGLELKYEAEVTEASQPEPDGPVNREQQSTTFDLRLGVHHFALTVDDVTTVYDFAERRILTLYPQAHVYRSRQLHWVVHFRESEAWNRRMLTQGLGHAGISEERSGFASFWIDHMFGHSWGEATHDELTEEIDGSIHRFTREGIVVAEFEPSEHVLQEARARMYARFLLYIHPVHPSIQEKIDDTGRVLKRLHYHRQIMPRTTTDVVVILEKVSATEDAGYELPDGMKLGYPPDEEVPEIERIGVEVLNQTHEAPRWSRQQFVDTARQKTSEGKYFEAFLLILEAGWQTGHQEIGMLRRIADHEEAAPRIRVLTTAMALISTNPKQALEALRTIDRSDVERPYVIDVLMGDAEMNGGRKERAEELFLNALRHNPYLTGVYKDLGSLYIMTYKHERAYFCLDVARFIAPKHVMIQAIISSQEEIVRKHPEFF